LPDIQVEGATAVDLVKRIDELTARYIHSMLEHQGLSRFAVDQYQSYKSFYDGQERKE